jgi:hypothetical protein
MKIARIIKMLILIFGLTGTAITATYTVYPDGSGEWPNIQAAIDTCVDGDTVLLADGTFRGRGNINLRYYGTRIVVKSQSGIAEACIIDVEGLFNEIAERGFIFDHAEDTLCVLKDITIINGNADALCPQCEGGAIWINGASPKITNLILRDNYALDGGGIMIVGGGKPIIRDCVFESDSAYVGGGLMCRDYDTLTVSHCLFRDNRAYQRGGAVALEGGCLITLDNCTISHNGSPNGSGIAAWDSKYIVRNTIVSFNDSGPSVFAIDDSSYMFLYSDIYGNEGGDWITIIADQLGANGNISANPAYVDTANGNFRITSGSPCVDAGDPLSPYDPDGSRADMGAYYYDHLQSIDDNPPIPENFFMLQNYPNPFNAKTVIKYNLPIAGRVEIAVYNLAGQKVADIVDETQQEGVHQIVWDASSVTSGVYFARIATIYHSSTTRMIMLK